MLPHRSILSNCRGAFELLRPLRPAGRDVSVLPAASHSYEHTVGQFFLPSIGTEIVYCRGVEHLAADLLAVRPTILTAVPRVLEVIRARVLTQVARQPGWQQALFRRALADRPQACRTDAGSALVERLLDPLLDRLVRAKVRARFGGRLKAAMSGGARLEPEVGRFFLALGSDDHAGLRPDRGRPGDQRQPAGRHPHRYGRAACCRASICGIADDGEILVRGDLVMDGYWGRPEATAAAIQRRLAAYRRHR